MIDWKNENSQKMWDAALWEENRGSINYLWDSAPSQLLEKIKDEISSSCQICMPIPFLWVSFTYVGTWYVTEETFCGSGSHL